jgi:S-adenosylmethionine:tRNA ribosyltransferase-isomerase
MIALPAYSQESYQSGPLSPPGEGQGEGVALSVSAHGALTQSLDFDLPPELEAREPPEAHGLRRDEVRLLVSYLGDDRIVHARFDQLPDFLRPGDLLVANDSATLPAALHARRSDGAEIDVHLSTNLAEQIWVVEPRHVTVATGEVLTLPGGGSALLLGPYNDSRRLWIARLDLPAPIVDYLDKWGRPITYSYVRDRWPIELYQTVYARAPGSVEMPSAGRAFSEEVLARLVAKVVDFLTLTLHCGISSLEEHEAPYPEFCVVPAETAEAVNAAKAAGRRVIAVGTTVVRALESTVDDTGRVSPWHGWTNLVVTPDRGVRAIDGLLTGFHEPRASHLALLEAIAGHPHLEHAYRAALAGRYLWHEFGDLHLLLPGTA